MACFAPTFPSSPGGSSCASVTSEEQWHGADDAGHGGDVPGWPLRFLVADDAAALAAAPSASSPLGADERDSFSVASTPERAQGEAGCPRSRGTAAADEDAHPPHGDGDRSSRDQSNREQSKRDQSNRDQSNGDVSRFSGEGSRHASESDGEATSGRVTLTFPPEIVRALSASGSNGPAAPPLEPAEAARRRGLSFSTIFPAPRSMLSSPGPGNTPSRMPIPRTHSSNSAAAFGSEPGFFGNQIPRTFSVGSAPGSPASSTRQRSSLMDRLGSLTPLGGASPIPSRLASWGKAVVKKLSFAEAPLTPSAQDGTGRRARRKFRRNQGQAHAAKDSRAYSGPVSAAAVREFRMGSSGRRNMYLSGPQQKLSEAAGKAGRTGAPAEAPTGTCSFPAASESAGKGGRAVAFLALHDEFASSASASPGPIMPLPPHAVQSGARLSQKPLFFSGPLQFTAPTVHKVGPTTENREAELDARQAVASLTGDRSSRQYLTPFDIAPNPQEVTAHWSQKDWYLFVSAAHAGLSSGPSPGVPEAHLGATQKLLQQLLVINFTPSSLMPNASSDTSELGGSHSPGGSHMTSSDSGESVSDEGRQGRGDPWADEPGTGSTSPASATKAVGPTSPSSETDAVGPTSLSSATKAVDPTLPAEAVLGSRQDRDKAPEQQSASRHAFAQAAFDMGAFGPSACPHLAQLAAMRDHGHTHGVPPSDSPGRCPVSAVPPAHAHKAEAEKMNAGQRDSTSSPEGPLISTRGPLEQSASSTGPEGHSDSGTEAAAEAGFETNSASGPKCAAECQEGETGAKCEAGCQGEDGKDEEQEDEDEDSWESVLLESATRAKHILLHDKTPNGRRVCEHLLSAFLDLTGSEMGFIASAHCKADGKMFLKTHAITNIGWTPELKQWYTDNRDTGLVFSNMDTLFGAVVKTANVVISNQPESDGRSRGVPLGHPTISAFLGIPLFAGAHPGGKLVGVLALANTDDEYSDDLVEDLAPLIRTASTVLTNVLHKRHEPHVMQGIAEEAEEEAQESESEPEEKEDEGESEEKEGESEPEGNKDEAEHEDQAQNPRIGT